MKKFILAFGIFGLLFTSCEKDEEVFEEKDLTTINPKEEEGGEEANTPDELEVEKFVYAGMNEIYLYKADVPTLEDSYFSTDSEKTDFLEAFRTPEELFEGLRWSDDRFSFITDNYFALEDRFNGVSSTTTGMKFGLGRISGTNNVFGFLQYILPGTSAEEEGLTRGTVFTEINGEKMTLNNYSALMDAASVTINIGKVEGGTLKMTEKTVTLDNTAYTTNPVLLAKTLDVEGEKVGYLMYTSFTGDFDENLNAAFSQFKADGVSNLVLDLRYNGGGSVETAVDLASMITGQFKGEIFMKEQWNESYQDYFENNYPERLINRFDQQIRTKAPINSLNLSKVYILTSEVTASASELVINGLEPYIDVVQIGETTTGKFQASVTLYDSPDFGREGASENHTYAIQPLVFKSANASGKSDYVNGLVPDVQISETLENLGTLGDPSEPFLQAALNHLLGKAQETKSQAAKIAAEKFETIGESGMNEINYQRMYTDKIPPISGMNKK